MSSSRDDFGIAFRSALLQRGAAQKFSLFFLIIIAIIIFFLDTYGFGFMKPVRSFINDGIYRVSLVASSPTRFIPYATGGVRDLLRIKSENEQLKKALEVYRQKELSVEYLTNQNKNLRKILDSDLGLFKEDVVLSKVLIDKDSPYLKSIIINKGSKSGILKGMPVMDKKYLIGRIVETNYLSSRVLLLNDLNSRLPVTFGKEGIQAILKGSGRSNPILEYLPEGYVVEKGIEVFTSGKDRIFFPGSPVGVTTEKGDVKLFSESSQLSFVKVDISKQHKEAF
ncbi:MAG: rod shape-determining protein MreC [Candidatus Pelagibacter sp. TMED153]|nr:MAG: rod shape-determining protein MreC [Candidatus Pelagibacter sp. TMED153]|tara:strand:- start:2805 stop:3650 length:846 start_codon:yes stop_codon:yes gene_type:complete